MVRVMVEDKTNPNPNPYLFHCTRVHKKNSPNCGHHGVCCWIVSPVASLQRSRPTVSKIMALDRAMGPDLLCCVNTGRVHVERPTLFLKLKISLILKLKFEI